MMEIVDDVAVSSNHSSFLYYMLEEDVPSYEAALNDHANDVSYDEDVYVDVCVGVCMSEDVDEDEDVNLPSYKPNLKHDLPNSACYDRDDAVALEKALADLVLVVLGDGKKVVDLKVVVVVDI